MSQANEEKIKTKKKIDLKEITTISLKKKSSNNADEF
jgi:hypothetical protein